MNNIIEIRNAVVRFFKENSNSKDVTVIKLEKVNDIWDTIAEVYEDDSFLKSMNLPPKKSRVFYSVKLDSDKEVIAFERLESPTG